MCFSLEEFAQKSFTKPVSSNWLFVNTKPKKLSIIENKGELVSLDVSKPKLDTEIKIINMDFKFYADKDSLKLGEGTFIHWDIQGEERVTLSYSTDGNKFEINSAAFANKGKNRVSPKTTTFYKIKSNSTEKTIKINILNSIVETPKIVKRPSIEYFYFENDEVKLGESTTLKWSVNNIANVVLETSINGVNWSVEENALYSNVGEKIIYPKRKVYYKLVANDDTTIILTLNVTHN